MSVFDRFSYDGSEPPAVAECAYCGEPIRAGDDVTWYHEDGAVTHDHCERGYVNSVFVTARGVI
jgi:hypothetical protein